METSTMLKYALHFSQCTHPKVVIVRTFSRLTFAKVRKDKSNSLGLNIRLAP